MEMPNEGRGSATSRLVERFYALTAPGSDSVAIEDARGTLTFEELGKRAQGLARTLRRRGLEGARVALLTTPSSDWVVGFFGILLAGGAVVALSVLHPPREQQALFRASGARGIVVSGDLAGDLAIAETTTLVRVDDLAETSDLGASPVSDACEALILFTSGTTGRPKGARLSHGNLSSLSELLGRAWAFEPRDRLMHVLPLHHLHGIGISLLVSLLAGARTLMLPRFEPEEIWERMDEVTVLMGVPTQHRRLLDAYDALPEAERDRYLTAARSLRLVTSGSAALPESLARRWAHLVGQPPLERYGMTEVGIPLSNPLVGERRLGSVGRVLPGMRVRIVDETGQDVPPGAPGEIQIKGPTVFLGYDGEPELTAEAFVDGWFRSGDTGTWLEDGYVKILGRTSVDILKSGGYKLSALEIEEALRECECVADVAVVGVPDEIWGEIAVAVVVPIAGREAACTEARLRAWAKERMAAYKVPRRVIGVGTLPRNALGKVVKPELREIVRRVLAAAE
jgi:malonyl-CoA/methylmalonyl-CoA synthetase